MRERFEAYSFTSVVSQVRPSRGLSVSTVLQAAKRASRGDLRHRVEPHPLFFIAIGIHERFCDEPVELRLPAEVGLRIPSKAPERQALHGVPGGFNGCVGRITHDMKREA